MKKTILFTLLAVFVLTMLTLGAFADWDDEPGVVTVTYRAELSSPLGKVPENNYIGIIGEENKVTMEFEKGYRLGESVSDIPMLYCAGDITYEWNIDPHGYELTEDITFVVTINNDDTVPAYFRAVDSDGITLDMAAKLIEANGNYVETSALVVFTKKGEKFNPDYIPVVPGACVNGFLYLQDTDFEPNPKDYVMNEPTEFICHMTPHPTDTTNFTVAFKVEFTNPMEIKDGYYIMTRYQVPYFKNGVVMEEHLPQFRFLGEGITFEGWDKDPVNTIVTEDMSFTAIFNNDEDCVPVYFKAVDEDGEVMRMFGDPEADLYGGAYPFYYSFVTFVKKGTVLDEKTIPAVSMNYGYYGDDPWNVKPMGYVVNETFEFILTYRYYYTVSFIAPKIGFNHEQYVHRGEAAVAPEVPETEGYLFLGWDKDFSNITDQLTVYAIMYEHGDANMDDAVNTGDAVYVLRHCADISLLTDNALTLADANGDKVVNTADAVTILRRAAEMN